MITCPQIFVWVLTSNALVFSRIINTFHHFQSVVIGVPNIVVLLRHDVRAEPLSFGKWNVTKKDNKENFSEK